uniref:GROUCHO n=1 Tax=Pristionchus pacificus TaxID=54126 RepID=Q4VKB1_PRIPA|nr:GROUCHO [Pristionchus pacificus]
MDKRAGSRGGGGGGNPFLDALEKLKDDYNHMQAQLSSQRAELDKMNAEKEQLQRHYMMYYEMSCGLNMEMQKQSEVAKRMTALLQSMLQYAPHDAQASTIQAMERAKQISLQELQQLTAASQAQQMLGMTGPMAAMGGLGGMAGALGGPGGLNMAAIAAAMGAGLRPPAPPGGGGGDDRPAPSSSRQSSSRQRSGSPAGGEKKPKLETEDGDDDEIDVQNDDPAGPAANGKTGGRDSVHSGISSSGASTPAAAAAKNFAAQLGQQRLPLAQLDPATRMMMQGMMAPNGKAPYSYRVDSTGNLAPTMFPPDALTDPGVPKSVKAVHDLPHGEVVCAVAISKDAQRVFTGGKGCVKIWDLAANTSAARARLECLEDNYIRSCKLFAEGTHLVVGGEASNILLFDIETQKEVAKLDTTAQACYALALNQESKLLYACCADGAVVIFDLASMQEVARLPGHTDGASCVDLSGDGLRLWTGGLDHTLRSWDIRERRELSNIDFASQIFSLGCSPTEDWVAVGLDTNQIEVVNTAPGVKERYQLHRHDSCVLSLRFAHSGKWFCTTGKDNLLNVWRSPYGALSVRASESSSVLSCDISHDDSVIVTGSGEKKATVYQVQYESSS